MWDRQRGGVAVTNRSVAGRPGGSPLRVVASARMEAETRRIGISPSGVSKVLDKARSLSTFLFPFRFQSNRRTHTDGGQPGER